MMALYAALLAQAWNMLGGYGGQFSFGHALFFGTGAYVQAHRAVDAGLECVGSHCVAASRRGRRVGAFVGALTFRYGLKGSYFALVTLAFAEVFRILAVSVDFTGGGVGLMLPLRESFANLQFASRRGYIGLMLGFVVAALLATVWLRHSRFGAQLQAVRDNEDAARAIGVDPCVVKLGAITLSAALHGRGRRVLRAGVPVHRPGHRLRPGEFGRGAGGRDRRRHGHAVGAGAGRGGAARCSAELTRNLFGELPGLNMVDLRLGAGAHRDVRAARAVGRGAQRARCDSEGGRG